MQYRVIFFEMYSLLEAIKNLEKEISKMSEDGWKLQGGICVYQNANGSYQVFQAIIK